MEIAIIAFIILIILMILKVPIAFATGIATMIAVAFAEIPLSVVPQRMFFGVDTFTLIAVPLFILAGRLMAISGITQDLLNLSKVLVGHLRGGLAYVNIVASMIFAGITGSAASDTSSIGSILIPTMIQHGYEKDFTVAVTATSSTIGVMIPPSIAMVLYGVAANQSIGKLFLGGAIPGLLVGIGLMAVTYILARKRNYPVDVKIKLKEGIKIVLKGIPALMSIVLIIGGIVTGIFTPTESAGFGVFYTFLLGKFYYKELKLSQLPQIIGEVADTVGMVMLMVATASALGWLLANQQIPRLLATSLLSITNNKIVLLLLINILLLFVGMWLDMSPAIIIFTPILLPIITQLGIDPVHFGVIMVVNLAIGLFTPPVGVCLFIACGIAETSLVETVKAFIPFVIVMIVILLFITFIPPISMFLPNLLMG